MLTLHYERVSTEGQARSGLGKEAQMAANGRLHEVLRREYAPQNFTDDGVSRSISFRERPAARGLMARVEVALLNSERDIIVIAYSLERMFGDVDDGRATLRWFSERGVRVYLSNEGGNALDLSSAMGLFLVTIRLAQGELERGLGCERTQAAMEARRERGIKLGDPFGWRTIEGVQCPEVVEQGIIAEMVALNDGRSLRDIARVINSRGHRTRDGYEFSHVQVKRIIERMTEENGNAEP